MFIDTMEDAAYVVFKGFSSKLTFLFVDFTFLESNTLVFTSLKLIISSISYTSNYIHIVICITINQ